MVCADIAMRPMRSPRIAAIGASSTGGRSTAMPGSARRKLLTQATSRKQPDHLPERQDDADQQHADDQRVEAGIGHEGRPGSAGAGRRRPGAEDQEHQHPDQKDAGRGKFERIEVSRHGWPSRRRSIAVGRTLWHRPWRMQAPVTADSTQMAAKRCRCRARLRRFRRSLPAALSKRQQFAVHGLVAGDDIAAWRTCRRCRRDR